MKMFELVLIYLLLKDQRTQRSHMLLFCLSLCSVWRLHWAEWWWHSGVHHFTQLPPELPPEHRLYLGRQRAQRGSGPDRLWGGYLHWAHSQVHMMGLCSVIFPLISHLECSVFAWTPAGDPPASPICYSLLSIKLFSWISLIKLSQFRVKFKSLNTILTPLMLDLMFRRPKISPI